MRGFLPIARSSSSVSIMCFSNRTAISVFPEPAFPSETIDLGNSSTVLACVKHSYDILLLSLFEKLELILSWISDDDS